MTLHKFTIKAPLNSHETAVEIDGKILEGVRRISFDVNGNGVPTVLCLQVFGEIEVEGEFRDEDIVSLRCPNAAR